MKKIFLTITGFLVTLLSIAQSPNLMNYQGVARNSVGNVLKNQAIGLRLSILNGGPTGTVVYSETRNVTTNLFGLFNVIVGGPGAITTTGTIAGVNWTGLGAGSGTKYLQVEIDPLGGTTYVNVGSTQLVSVPYALNSGASAPIGPAGGDLTGTYPNPLLKLPYTRSQADAGVLFQITNSGTGNSIEGINTGTGRGGYFVVNNAASVADAIRAETNGIGASWGIRAISSGTNGGGFFQQTNLTNTANNVQSTQAGLGRAGLFTANNAANAANALEATTTGTGFAIRAASTNAVPMALLTVGNVQHTGIGEAINFVLRSDATGNATWVDPVTLLPGANFWSRVGTNLFATNLGDNVGVGTNTPTHKFTVSHAGSTGISVSSTAGFSVIDINAQNGDAALRFGNNGVNQWNTRNRPGDNYMEWFELGGGGSRMVIQDGTGNVGIGETTNPTYRLDVLHGGATGIRSRSSAGFSVVDIDAFTGDAALRFMANGVSQWNMRNRPADNYFEWFELGGGGSRMVIQDGTGNVGIGETANPTYKLDVLHGGATGIRSRSSGTFSVIDIDAFNGDAALRFQAAGVGQWNTRNRPADNYYEIFELGGGGSRIVIQDGSGNVGIGETTNPTYKLDVLHGGATGIRSRSSGTFSVIDIDAANGDAALRFAKAGVNQWNIRNRPADDYLEIFELGGGGSRVVIQDGTGNVGIGETTNPTYKLDVLHGGATGIRSRSSGTFSVIDIDAANGDAALRFAKAGVNQWNIRNRPADDYLEIFELGGGGSRLVVQNGSGNVGIGQTTNPTYKLDVLHGGATGLRVQSSATFSVIDIDGQNGDAALRFVRAGVNQWNIRNNPANDDLQFFELGGGGERMRIENTTGNVVVNGNLSKGGGAFKIDHPLDPANKYLYHSFVESPDMMNIYNGNVVTDASGKAVVKLPAYFEALNMEYRYQLTVIGSFAQAIINKEVSSNQFEIATNQPNVKVSWQVTGIRHDAYANQNRIPNEVDKAGDDKGKYLHPKAFNQPMTKAIGYDASNSSLSNVKPAALKTANPEIITGTSLEAPAKVVNNKVVDKTGSVIDVAPAKAVNNKVADKTGSVIDVTPAKPVVKPADNSGSVAPETKKEQPKPTVKPTEKGSTGE